MHIFKNKDVIMVHPVDRSPDVPAKTSDDNLPPAAKSPSARTSSQKSVLRLTVAGVLAALILVATLFIKVPTAIGYANMGDGVILFAAYLLGPFAFFPAAIGSALADLMAGYPVYIPATFIIKGIMGLVVGYIMKKDKVTVLRKIIAFSIAEGIMVAGYFLFEAMIYGVNVATLTLIPNLIQGAVGITLAMILCVLLEKLRWNVREKLI